MYVVVVVIWVSVKETLEASEIKMYIWRDKRESQTLIETSRAFVNLFANRLCVCVVLVFDKASFSGATRQSSPYAGHIVLSLA